MKHPQIPSFTYRLFKWFCKDEMYEELEGDLEESFIKNAESYGLTKARRIYRKEIFKMIRPSIIKKTQSRPMNNAALLSNYSVVAFRNLYKNKLFSTINIIGLSMSLAVGMLTIAFTDEMVSYDTFHEKKDRIYRVYSTRTRTNSYEYATTSLYTGEKLKEYKIFDGVTSINNSFQGDIEVGDKLFQVRGIYADNDFLDVFTFPLISGDRKTVLSEPNSLVLTEDLALKMFSSLDVLEEIVLHKGVLYTITGIAQNPPYNSHLKFDALASLETLKTLPDRRQLFSDWGAMWNSYVYVLFPEKHDPSQFESAFHSLESEANEKLDRVNITLGLEQLAEIFPGDQKNNQQSTVMPKKRVNQIIVLTIIVLFSACFNYTNLSIARSLKRAKEVGIRKTVGASKAQLFIQFILESVIISLLALVIGFVLFQLIKPEFVALDPHFAQTTLLNITSKTVLLFVGLAVLTGLLAGFFPSLILTKFNPSRVLKGTSSIRLNRRLGLREIMVGLQFVFSMGFAILVTLTYKQYNYALNFDLGYETTNVLTVPLQGNDEEIVMNAFSQLPEIESIASASAIPSTGWRSSDYAKLPNSLDSAGTYNFSIDQNYIQTMDHELIAGRNFAPDSPEEHIIVNEQFVKRFQLVSPQEALGTRVIYYGKGKTIIGVVKDFHYGTIFNELRPFAFVAEPNKRRYLMLKVNSSNLISTMNRLADEWDKIDSKHQFDATFYSEKISSAYQQLSSSMKTFGLLAVIAISISILGLLGMAVYTTESRMKELTIRKVLGATFNNLAILLSKNFVPIFLLASLVAIPMSYLVFQKTIVNHMEYVSKIGWIELGSGAILVIIIALVTISSQTFRAAKTNPATNLRNE